MWVDVDDLQPGCQWMEVIEDALLKCNTFLVYIGRTGIKRWVDFEVRTALYRYVDRQDLQIIPVLGPGVSPDSLPPFLSIFHNVKAEEYASTAALASAIKGLLNSPPMAVKKVLPEGCSPFPGLRPFANEEAELFFGRDEDIARCIDLLGRHKFVAVVGDSGSGKSSFLSAGVLPAVLRGRLYRERRWLHSCAIVSCIPSDEPFRQLAKALVQLGPEETWDSKARKIGPVAEELQTNPRYLTDCLENLLPMNTAVLLVIDRVEDLFMLVTDQEQRNKFLGLLEALPLESEGSNIYCLLGIRSDKLDRLWDYERLWSLIRLYQYPIRRMREQNLREIITRPLALAGCTADAPLLTTLLTDVGTEPGNLALLQHALYRMWRSRTSEQLSGYDYDRIGRLEGTITNHANDIFDSLKGSPHGKVFERCMQRWFIELTHLGEGGEDTRRRVTQENLFATTQEVLSEADSQKLLNLLVNERLLTVSRELDIPSDEQQRQGLKTNWIEVSHETLIRRWTLLRQWIDARRDAIRLGRRFTTAAEEWKGVGADALLTGVKLQEAIDWRSENHDLCPPAVSLFIDASIEAQASREAARARQRRRERIMLAGIILFLASTAVLLFVFYIQASNERARLQIRSDISAATTLTKEADELWRLDPALIPKMEEWISRAQSLLERNKEYQVSLDRLKGNQTSDGLLQILELQQAINSINAFQKSGLLAKVGSKLELTKSLAALLREGGPVEQHWQQATAAGIGLPSDYRLIPIRRDTETGLWEFVLTASMNQSAGTSLESGQHDGIVLVMLPETLHSATANGALTDYRLLISKHPLTRSQFLRMARNNINLLSGDPAQSLTNVSWQTLNEVLPPYGLEIPSEKEWLMACQYGPPSASPFVNIGAPSDEVGSGAPTPVGTGIAEWCFDVVGSGSERMICGTGSVPAAAANECSVRGSLPAVFAASDVGVRPIFRLKVER